MDSLGENVRKGGSSQYNILRTFREWEEASDSVREAERWSEVEGEAGSGSIRDTKRGESFMKNRKFQSVR